MQTGDLHLDRLKAVGGKALATVLGHKFVGRGVESKYIYPEKKVVALATEDSREKTELIFDRHEPARGEHLWIVEDVCNNFSTTAYLVALIEGYGAFVDGIACFLNRSLDIDNKFSPRSGLFLPIVSLVRQPIRQWRQDDPKVVEDVQSGNVVWKPKDEWGRLLTRKI